MASYKSCNTCKHQGYCVTRSKITALASVEKELHITDAVNYSMFHRMIANAELTIADICQHYEEAEE